MNKECLDGDRIVVIHGFLTDAECSSFVEKSERAGYDEATITTAAGFAMVKDIRDNARLIVDDGLLADAWWPRARLSLPESIDEWHVVGFNERFRFYRYDSGQKFAPTSMAVSGGTRVNGVS